MCPRDGSGGGEKRAAAGRIEFFVPLGRIPTATAQQRRHDRKGRTYETAELAEARADLSARFARYAPAAPLGGPLRLELVWCFPTRGRHRQGEPKTTPPDLDNANKMPQDVLMRLGFFKDDSQIADLHDMKVWSDPGGVYVRVERIEWKET